MPTTLEAAHSLELEAISRRYGRRWALRGVAARIHSGQVLVFAGGNGAGKTTLLRIVAGLTRPTSGQVRLYRDGQQLAPAHVRRLIGLAAADVALYGELTARENLAFFARVRGLRLAPAEGQRLLAKVGLAGREDDPVQAYSSGMHQRLKLACAVLHRPPFLLLDEPGLHLDEDGRALVEALVQQQRQGGLAVLATNDAREVAYGDVVLFLGKG